jgi:hypothetical protein
MWADWRPEVVEADLRQLAAAGLQALRVFPLWPDFQPLILLRTGAGQPREYRLGEAPLPLGESTLPEDESGRAGVSPTAIQHFAEFADLAEKYGLKLIAGLITGWMSGRLFVPPAFEGLNVLTDPEAIQWQVRFVRYFVKRFKDHPAILAWDLGNECNVMALVPSRQAAWVWTNAITAAIRLEDASRPVVSGMHSLLPGRDDPWTMQDQGELTDLLTTHPYPYFTPHANADPVNTIRTILHSTAESRFYADIGGKPCLVEEIGTLGPMFAGEKVAAEFVRSVLFSLWAHDCHGLLWWCAYDQSVLEHAPYDWDSCERELGLIRSDRSEKPVLAEIGRFGSFLKGLPIQFLPPRRREAVCLLTEGQDSWGAAYSAFILARQAGFDLEFQYAGQPLKPAGLYLAPSVRGTRAFSRRAWLELLQRVHEGATLYLSHDDCLLSPVNGPFGIEIQTRERCDRRVEWLLDGIEPGLRLQVHPPYRLQLETRGASSLGREEGGNPALTCASYGQGQIYFLTAPIEMELTRTPGAFHGPEAQPFWKIYRHIARPSMKERAVRKEADPQVGITEHALEDGRRVVILINYSPEERQTRLALNEEWKLEEIWYGEQPASGQPGLILSIPGNEAAVFTLERLSPVRSAGDRP